MLKLLEIWLQTAPDKNAPLICIDGGPCETIKSNSNNFTELQDFLENKTKVTLIPREIV